MARTIIHVSARTATIGSFLCLAVQALWAASCLLIAQAQPPENWLVGALGFLLAGVVMSTLSLVGTALAMLAVSRPHWTGWAVAALVLNGLVLVGTTVPLLLLIGPMH
jgi:hypothetical protein